MSRALLIFARRPQPGRVKSRLSPFLTPEESAYLYDCMVRDLVARTAGLEVDDRYLMYENAEGAEAYFRSLGGGLILLPQQGEGLGERLSNAFNLLFGKGYTTLAVIGTDSPDLPLAFIHKAFERLEAGSVDVLFGPTEDGGYYLTAMRAPNPELFNEVPWSTNKVLKVSLQRAKEAGLFAELLPHWYDIDEPSDLARAELTDTQHDACQTRDYLMKLMTRRKSGAQRAG
jgi:uncharacterized protein